MLRTYTFAVNQNAEFYGGGLAASRKLGRCLVPVETDIRAQRIERRAAYRSAAGYTLRSECDMRQVMAEMTEAEGIEIPASAPVRHFGYGAPADSMMLESSGAAT